MMSGAAPLVSNGITWMHGAAGERIHLSAFLMTFATALLIYSPMFTARNVAIRTITDRRSLYRFAGFNVACATSSSVGLFVVSQFDVAGGFIFQTLLHADPQIEMLAREGLLVFIPIPILVALRGMGQGCHISNGQSWYVGVGTSLRLSTMAIFVFGYAIHHDLTGPVLGGMTYLTGITAETVFMVVTLWNKPQWRNIGQGPVLSYKQFGRYAGPLMLASTFNLLSYPILIHLINVGQQPGESGASYNLLRDTAWLMFSVLIAVQPTIIAHATSAQNWRVIVRFGTLLAGSVTGLAMLVALTSLRNAIFIRWLDVDNVLIQQLTFEALRWMIPIPFINTLWLSLSALHTRSGRTIWTTAGNLAGLMVLLLVAVGWDLSAHNGAVVAIVGVAVFNLVSSAVQLAGLLNGGFEAALSPRTLAEHFNGEPERQAETHGEPASVPCPQPVVQELQTCAARD